MAFIEPTELVRQRPDSLDCSFFGCLNFASFLLRLTQMQGCLGALYDLNGEHATGTYTAAPQPSTWDQQVASCAGSSPYTDCIVEHEGCMRISAPPA